MKEINLLHEAELYCETKGLRSTEPRRAVLGIVAESKTPIGAYEIIDRMPAGTKPPTVYRALAFWEKEGFLHRIGSLNAYATCTAGHRHSGAQFMICNDCGSITETHICTMPGDVAAAAKGHNFQPDGWFLELRGTCGACRTDSTHHGCETKCGHHH